MHDSVFFEDHGVPTATILTSEFVRAAQAQAAALGATDFVPVVVDHPIQPLTPDEVRGRADEAFGAVIARLTRPTA